MPDQTYPPTPSDAVAPDGELVIPATTPVVIRRKPRTIAPVIPAADPAAIATEVDKAIDNIQVPAPTPAAPVTDVAPAAPVNVTINPT